jgi:hypothetical protein
MKTQTKKMKGLLFIAIILVVASCNKPEKLIVKPNKGNNSKRARVEAFSLYSSTNGVSVYNNSKNDYIVVADFTNGETMNFSANPINIDANCNVLPSSPTSPNILKYDKKVSGWMAVNTNTKLWAIGNGTFFWYGGRPCPNNTPSTFPIKNQDGILATGNGGSSADLKLIKKTFYISRKYNATTKKYEFTPGVTTFSDNGLPSSYSLSSVTSKLSSYYSAMIGFEVTQYRSTIADNLSTGRTILGVNGKKVYVIYTNDTKDGALANLKNFSRITDNNSIVLFDGSGSTQIAPKNNSGVYSTSNGLAGDRNIPSVMRFYGL